MTPRRRAEIQREALRFAALALEEKLDREPDFLDVGWRDRRRDEAEAAALREAVQTIVRELNRRGHGPGIW